MKIDIDSMESLSKYVRTTRKALGISQTELALAIGQPSRITVGRLEKGSSVSARTILDILQYFAKCTRKPVNLSIKPLNEKIV